MMKAALVSQKIIVKRSSLHGYGVFADEDIRRGELIEECYVLRMKQHILELENYYFMSEDQEVLLLSLGNGSLYNHSSAPNAKYEFDIEHSLLIFSASQDIKQGAEICISYGMEWLSSRNAVMKEPSWRYKFKQCFSRLAMIWKKKLEQFPIFGLVIRLGTVVAIILIIKQLISNVM